MVANLKQLMRMLAMYARMDLRWFLQDAKTCLIVIVSELISSVSAASGVLLLAARFGGVGSLSATEVLWMLGYYMLTSGSVYMLFGGCNVRNISRRIGRGQFDHMLIQPVPLPLQLLSEGVIPVSGNSEFLVGLGLTIFASAKLQLIITPAWLLTLIALIVSRVGIEMGIAYLLGASAFYKPVACEEISSVGVDLLATLGRFPLAGVSGALRGVLLTLLPAGLMAWFPSLILLDKAPIWPNLLLPIGVAASFITLAVIYFQKGMKHYAQFSCNRYRDMGYRN